MFTQFLLSDDMNKVTLFKWGTRTTNNWLKHRITVQGVISGQAKSRQEN